MTIVEWIDKLNAKGEEPTASAVIQVTKHQWGNDEMLDSLLGDWLDYESQELHYDEGY